MLKKDKLRNRWNDTMAASQCFLNARDIDGWLDGNLGQDDLTFVKPEEVA